MVFQPNADNVHSLPVLRQGIISRVHYHSIDPIVGITQLLKDFFKLGSTLRAINVNGVLENAYKGPLGDNDVHSFQVQA